MIPIERAVVDVRHVGNLSEVAFQGISRLQRSNIQKTYGFMQKLTKANAKRNQA